MNGFQLSLKNTEANKVAEKEIQDKKEKSMRTELIPPFHCESNSD